MAHKEILDSYNHGWVLRKEKNRNWNEANRMDNGYRRLPNTQALRKQAEKQTTKLIFKA